MLKKVWECFFFKGKGTAFPKEEEGCFIVRMGMVGGIGIGGAINTTLFWLRGGSRGALARVKKMPKGVCFAL